MKPLLVERWTEYAKDFTSSPSIFHEFMAYATVGAITARQVYLPSGNWGVYPNVYMALIAPSSAYYKTTALNIAKDFLRCVSPEELLPVEFSHESLVEQLAGKTTGINSGVFCFSEFKTLLGQLKRDYMVGTKSFLTEIYDSLPGYARKTKSTNAVLDNPFVNIWAATTIDWFMKEIKEDDLSSGFLARFLFVAATKKEGADLAYPPPASEAKRLTIINQLEEIKKIKGRCRLSDKAKELYEMFYRKTAKEILNITHDYACIYLRLNTYLLKLAVINAVMNLRTEIQEEDVYNAQAYIQYATTTIENILENDIIYTKTQRSLNNVLKYVQAKKDKGIARAELIWRSHVSSKYLDELVKTLIEADKIFMKDFPVKGGTRAKFYFSMRYVEKKGVKTDGENGEEQIEIKER